MRQLNSIGRFTSTDRRIRLSLLALATFAPGKSADAHVKWFAPYDVAAQPRVLGKVVCTDFMVLSALAIAFMLAGCVLERTVPGEAIGRALDRITVVVRANADLLLRATCGFFLVTLWTRGGTLLTPELKTQAAWVPQLQLAMAASLMFRRTSLIAGGGILLLYLRAVQEYGIFHLLDYPIFVGVALCLIRRSLFGAERFGSLPLALLRYSASVTLMWASIEKWAYPEWTLPIYISHPAMTMGYGFDLFMQAAGVIEFTLAFALLWTPLVRRAAALVLLGMFVAATAEFGKIDVIGHSVIVAVLLLIVADDARPHAERHSWRRITSPALAYAVALMTILSLYYGMHMLIFSTPIT